MCTALGNISLPVPVVVVIIISDEKYVVTYTSAYFCVLFFAEIEACMPPIVYAAVILEVTLCPGPLKLPIQLQRSTTKCMCILLLQIGNNRKNTKTKNQSFKFIIHESRGWLAFSHVKHSGGWS